MTILFVRGGGDEGAGELQGVNSQGVLMWSAVGCCAVQAHLHLPKEAAENIMMFGLKTRQPPATFHKKPSLVFNQISDPDIQSGALTRCAEMCEQLSVPVINRPANIMKTTRDRVAETLNGIPGVVMPKTCRGNPRSPDEVFDLASEAGLEFPFIVRLAGKHGGHDMSLIHGRQDYHDLHAFPFDGRDFYLIEYVDYKNDKGLFLKTRIAVIDGEPVIRHVFFNETWKVHGASIGFMRKQPDFDGLEVLARKAEARLPELRPAIDEIHGRLGLEYFGIDCHINNQGEMLVFEANASMNFFVNPDNLFNREIDIIRNRIIAMISRHSGENLR